MSLKAKPYAGSGVAAAVAGKTKRRERAGLSTFNGVVVLNEAEFARLEQCMTNPGEPTEAAHRGAELLKKLYG
jgi:hypothetical protein